MHTGFPSDHYMLLTEIQVKLAHRPPRPPPKLNLTSITPSQVIEFNAKVRESLTGEQRVIEHTHPTDHSAVHFYTDGSGSSGKCSAQTPAGWGWCYQQGDAWIEACRPVPTTSDHSAFLGATVGSHNAGELSAIVEAVPYAQEKELSTAIIHSDSRWAINMITGKWCPRTHAKFINDIRAIIRAGTTRVVLQWVKGHAGNEGNERADRLADEGKDSQQRRGGRTLIRHLPIEDRPQTTVTDIARAMKSASEDVFTCFKRNPRKP